MIRLQLAALSVFVTLWLDSSAQHFQKTYGDSMISESGQGILQTDDGGFLIAGTRYNSGNQNDLLFLIRTDAGGDTLWSKLIRELQMTYSGSQVIQTADQGYAVTGIKGGGNSFVPYLLKLDSSGNLLWNKSYLWFASEHINSLVQTPDSGFLLAGYFFDGTVSQIYFIRTNATGDTLWTRSFKEDFFNASVYSVKLTHDHGFVAAGSIQNTSTQDVDALLFKTDSLGNFQWAKGFGDMDYDYAQQVEITNDSGFAMAAVTYSSGAGLADFYLVKTDSLGDLRWAKSYGGISDDRSECIHQFPDGGFLISGESSSFSAGHFEVYVIRTDSTGDTLWTKAINGFDNNEGYGLTLTSDLGFAICGDWVNAFGNNDVYLIKADSSGSFGCREMHPPTQVMIPNTAVLNHHFNSHATSPSVVGHTLDVFSGAAVNDLCLTDGMSEEKRSMQPLLYPNPVISILSVNSMGNVIEEISIKDLRGRKIYSEQNEYPAYQTFSIELSDMPEGLYILELTTLQRVFQIKFIRQ